MGFSVSVVSWDYTLVAVCELLFERLLLLQSTGSRVRAFQQLGPMRSVALWHVAPSWTRGLHWQADSLPLSHLRSLSGVFDASPQVPQVQVFSQPVFFLQSGELAFLYCMVTLFFSLLQHL